MICTSLKSSNSVLGWVGQETTSTSLHIYVLATRFVKSLLHGITRGTPQRPGTQKNTNWKEQGDQSDERVCWEWFCFELFSRRNNHLDAKWTRSLVVDRLRCLRFQGLSASSLTVNSVSIFTTSVSFLSFIARFWNKQRNFGESPFWTRVWTHVQITSRPVLLQEDHGSNFYATKVWFWDS